MYRVISIEDYMVTRNIRLENFDTGTIDECFDDSSLVSKKCFDFIKMDSFYFRYSRKDLIQVNNIIHADLL